MQIVRCRTEGATNRPLWNPRCDVRVNGKSKTVFQRGLTSPRRIRCIHCSREPVGGDGFLLISIVLKVSGGSCRSVSSGKDYLTLYLQLTQHADIE